MLATAWTPSRRRRSARHACDGLRTRRRLTAALRSWAAWLAAASHRRFARGRLALLEREAALRRLTRRIYIPLPAPSDIKQLLAINLKSLPTEEDVDLEVLAGKMAGGGFSGADITNLCRDAAMMPMRRRIKGLNREEIKNLPKTATADLPVAMDDLLQALGRIHSSVGAADIAKHEQWLSEFGAV